MNEYYQAVYDHTFDENGKNLVRISEDSEFRIEFSKLMLEASKHASDSDFVDFCRYVTDNTETELWSVVEHSERYKEYCNEPRN